MSWNAVGRDSTICMLEEIATDKSGGSGSGSTTSTSWSTAASYSPAPAASTDYLLIAQLQAYYSDTTGAKCAVEFLQNTTALLNQGVLAQGTSYADYRSCMFLGKLTIAPSDTLYAKVQLVSGSGTMYYRSAGPVFLLLPWDSFAEPQIKEATTARTIVATSWTDVDSADHLVFTPTAGDHFVLTVAQVGGGVSTSGRTGNHRFSLDGTTKMESETIYTGSGSPVADMRTYLHASIETFDATSKTLKYQGMKGASGIGGGAVFQRQAIFSGRIPPGGRIVTAGEGFTKSKVGLVA